MPGGLLIYPTVKVDGSDLTGDAAGRLTSVEVDTTVHLPGMIVLEFADDATAAVLKAANINMGSELSVSSTGRSTSSPTALITAEVVSIEAGFGNSGVRTVVRAYEKLHRLHLARHSKTYANQTDSDIAKAIAGAAGLTVGTVDDTSVTYDLLAQVDQTDWEFLSARAKEIGYEVGMADGKFYFRKPIHSSTAPSSDTSDTSTPPGLELKWGANLLALDIRASGAGQAGTVTVRGWDPVNKKAITSDGTPASTEASNQFSPSDLSGKFGSATTVVVDRPVSTQAAADALAAGLAAAVGSNYVECDGAAIGDSALNAGVAVRLSGVGDFFTGKYTLTRVRHTFDEDGYVTHFEISGRRDRSFAGMTNPAGGGSTNSTNGLAIGQVTQNGDTQHVGMVKVKFPWLDDQYESDWIRIMVPGAGPNSGAVWYPEPDDEVLVGFEFGDSRRPYVLGGLWNGKDQPPEGDGLFSSGKVKRRGFVSRKGHKVVLFDDDSKSGIGLLSSDGKLKLSLNETNGEIKIHAGGKVTIITESGGDVTINSAGKLDIQTQGDASIQASGQVKLNGSGGVNVQSSGQVQISGSMIQIG